MHITIKQYCLFALILLPFVAGAQTKAHISTLKIPNRAAIYDVLDELKESKSIDGGSNDAIGFQIEYLEKVKELLAKCNDSDTFGQHLIAAYPNIDGTSNIRALSKALYPDEPLDAEKENVRILLSNYMKSLSEIDKTLAKNVWANSDEISIINAMGQFFGFESIFYDFIIKAFSELSERRLSSVSEVINIYGDFALIQFYWIFDIKDREGNTAQNRGRETLICRKVDNEWKIYHIHYSGMPR